MREMGGPQLPNTIEVMDALEYHNGDHVIVFLSEVGPGKYTSIAGPVSAFAVKNGVVSAHVPNNHLAKFTGPMPVASFVALVGK